MKIKSILLLLFCFLLPVLAMPAIACPPPDCGDCCYWVSTGPGPNDGYCELDIGAECGDCAGCSPCYSCVNCSCVWDCSTGQTCCNGSCCNSGNCCNSTTCCSNYDDVCCTDSGSYCCDSGKTCCQGNCCNPGQCCVDGECSSTCWTTSTTPASIQAVCADCVNIAWDHCPGEYEETIEHERCSPAPTGVPGRCECHETTGITGYTYECKVYPNWNWCLCPILWEMCEVACGVCPMEPTPIVEAACAACIIEYLHECITPCSYVDKCDKDDDDQTPKYGPKFSHFGGGTCTG